MYLFLFAGVGVVFVHVCRGWGLLCTDMFAGAGVCGVLMCLQGLESVVY